MHTFGNPAAVLAVVADDCAAEVSEVDRSVDAGLATLARDPTPAARDDRALRLEGAHRRARERLAREDWLDRRAALEAREAWIQRVMAEGLRRLREEPDPGQRRARLEARAREAFDELGQARGSVVAVAAAEASLLEGSGLPVVADPGLSEGACLARSSEGRLSFDNGVEARARRLEGLWRAALAEAYGS